MSQLQISKERTDKLYEVCKEHADDKCYHPNTKNCRHSIKAIITQWCTGIKPEHQITDAERAGRPSVKEGRFL